MFGNVFTNFLSLIEIQHKAKGLLGFCFVGWHFSALVFRI